MKRWLLLLLFTLVGAIPLSAQIDAIQGFCTLGGTQAQVSGLSSTSRHQGIVSGCTVTVYLTGTTTLATIYSNASGTILTNPFTAVQSSSANAGYWIFYAANAVGYDVKLSGGGGNPSCTTTPNCYATPLTYTDLKTGGGGTASNPAPPAFAVQLANSGATLFQADANIKINPTSHTFEAPFVQTVDCTGQRNGTDQAVVQAGINFIALNAPNGRGTLRVPEGQTCYIYMPSGSLATEALLMTTPVSFSGNSSQFYFDVPSTMSWMRIAPNAAVGYYPNSEDLFFNFVMRDVTMTGATAVGTPATTGNNGIVFDCTINALGKVLFENVTINLVNGNSFYMNNTTNANGCIYQSMFLDNHVANGYHLVGAGDSNIIWGGGITAPQNVDGVFLQSITGARQNEIGGGINIITGGCPVHVTSALGLVLDNIEVGIHLFGSTTCPADVWLQPSSAGAITGVWLRNSSLGTDEPATLGTHNLQIDSGTQNVNIEVNTWNPQVVSGTPTSVIRNNGTFTCIGPNQQFLTTTNFLFQDGSGSTCQSNNTANQGLGAEQENRLAYSEDGTQSVWGPLTSGGGTATISTVTGVVLPDGTTGSATRLQLAAGIGQSASIIQSVTGLPNPHASTEQVYIRNTTCPSSTVYNLSLGGAANNEEIVSDCKGDLNGWRKQSVGLPASVSLTTDYYTIGIGSGSPFSTTADVLITRMQESADLVPYIKTTATPVPLSYGYNGVTPVSRPRSPFGYQLTASGAPTTCTADNAGTVINWPASGPYPALANQVIECDLINTSPAVYAWQTVFQKPQQPENYLLQSDTWNSTPTWVFSGNAPAVIPVITAAPAVTDPFGNTGTVQEAFFNLNGDTHFPDVSEISQVVTLPLGATSGTPSIWLKAKTGTPLVFFGALGCAQGVTATATWQFISLPCAASGTQTFEMGLQAGLTYPNTADVYVFSGCDTFHGGLCTNPATGASTITTTALIDNTPYTAMDPGWTLGTAKVTPNGSTVQFSGQVSATVFKSTTGAVLFSALPTCNVANGPQLASVSDVSGAGSLTWGATISSGTGTPATPITTLFCDEVHWTVAAQ